MIGCWQIASPPRQVKIVLVKNEGLKIKDIKVAEMVLEENRELAIEKWNEYFGKSLNDEDL